MQRGFINVPGDSAYVRIHIHRCVCVRVCRPLFSGGLRVMSLPPRSVIFLLYSNNNTNILNGVKTAADLIAAAFRRGNVFNLGRVTRASVDEQNVSIRGMDEK